MYLPFSYEGPFLNAFSSANSSLLLTHRDSDHLFQVNLNLGYFRFSYLHIVLPPDAFFFLQEISVSPQGVAALTSPQVLLRHMQNHSIHSIASGGQAPNFKIFFFAQKQEEPSNFLVECIINTASAKAQVKVKADDQSSSQAFSSLFQSALANFGMP